MSIKAHSPWLTKRSALIGLLVLLAFTAVPIVVRAWRNHASGRSNFKTPTAQLTSLDVPQPRAIAQLESELITITPHGFEPRQITRPQGRILLMIDNRSGLALVAPRLAREAGPRLRDLRVPREEPNWSEVLELTPGRYVLTEADHPAWSCRIIITAQ